MLGTSAHTEGKIHLGFVYAKDPEGETHRLMTRGALAFAPWLREIAGIEPEEYARGARFHYAVPHLSQLDLDEIETHFQRVEETFLESQVATGHTYLGRPRHQLFTRLNESDLRRHFDPAAVAGAFETEEEAIDTLRLAEKLRNAVLQSAGIRFRGGLRVLEAAFEDGPAVRLVVEEASGRHTQKYDAVANCLWTGRLQLDATLDLIPERPWLFRYKALARWNAPELAASPVPSTTLIVGSYGDVVNYGDGAYYLSWYPEFKLAETQEIDGTLLENSLGGLDHRQLARRGVDAMAHYIPSLRCLASRPDVQVSGGVIFGWGSTDIDDPQSGLHQRWRIGPQRHGPYVSVDTGKYTMAPYFALEARSLIEEILA